MKRYKYIPYIISFLLISLLHACDDAFLERQPPSSLTQDIFYQTEADAISAVNAAYASLQLTGMYSENYPKVSEVPSDDVFLDNTGGLGFDNFTYNGSEPQLDAVWQSSYEGIFRANLVLQKIPDIDLDQDLQDRLLGEARFLRALYYWHLTTMFGDVPLITEADAEDPSKAEVDASPQSEIYDLMIEDLQAAIPALPVSYDESNLGRVTKGAAQALLGKVYIYNEQYAEAEAAFTEVINSGEYELLENFGDLLGLAGENSSESIFEVQYQDVGGNGWAGTDGASNNEANLRMRLNLPQGRGGFGNLLPTQDLVDEFEAYDGPTAINGRDPRLFHTVFIDGDPYDEVDPVYSADWTVTDYAIKKGMMPIIRDHTNSSRNFPIIRYADVLLMFAEAANANGNTQAAIAALNQVRDRVGMPPYPIPGYPVSNQEEVFDAIVHERRVELAFEYHRFNDLRRWGLAPDELSGLGYEAPKNRYMPYPQAEVDVNQELEQNPNY